MRDHGSLVLFTLSVQTAVGGVWCLQFASFGGVHIWERPDFRYQLGLILFLSIVGLGGAFLHLGNPLNSYHVFKNLKQSWLSREIALVGAFGGMVIIMIGVTQTQGGLLHDGILLLGSLTGGMAVVAMTRVYRLRTVPSWNHAGTPLAFLGSTLLLGGLLCTVPLHLQTWPTLTNPGVLAHDNYLKVIWFACAIAGLACKFLVAGIHSRTSADSQTSPVHQPVYQAGGLAAWMIYILINGNPGWQSLLLILTACGLISGETIHRIQFYQSYRRVGL